MFDLGGKRALVAAPPSGLRTHCAIVLAVASAQVGSATNAGPGVPSGKKYLAAYCSRRGLTGMPCYVFYMAINFFLIVAIIAGNKGRLLDGTATVAHVRKRVAVLLALMALAQAHTRGVA